MPPSSAIKPQNSGFQRELAVTVSARVVLVDIQAVRYVFGCTAESILHRVDDATREDHLRWVFNLSAGEGHRRELRFWVREIIPPEICGRVMLGQVLDLILGQREHFRRGELEIEWVCHHMTISALLQTKALSLHGTTIPRYALDNFLRTRWIGCATIPSPAGAGEGQGEGPGGNTNQLCPVRNQTTSASEKDTVTRQSALNGKHASIPARKNFAKQP